MKKSEEKLWYFFGAAQMEHDGKSFNYNKMKVLRNRLLNKGKQKFSHPSSCTKTSSFFIFQNKNAQQHIPWELEM